ncbi:diguanylate cyclase domain-containing protein [Marinobacter sp.]|uniref:diguanylate cyclase domain-containing protein n=1 Tax=Marinobacter sp. TaxID=50741 RepID=UPI003A944EEF
MIDSVEKSDVNFGSSTAKSYLFNSVFFIVSFWSLNQVAYLFSVTENVSIFYPPSGFAMLLIYLFGAKYIPVYFIAIIIGGLPHRDILNYDLNLFIPDIRQLVIYGSAGLLLGKIHPKKLTLNATFFYLLILTSIVTAFLSATIFLMSSQELGNPFSTDWFESVSLFLVGNLTGSLTALPIFIFYLYLKTIGWDALKSDVERNVLRPEKIIALFIILFLSFFVVSLGMFSENFSTYYYLVLVPIIWTAVKWGLGTGLMYAFIGNVFTLAMYVLFGYSYYGLLEVQLIFSVSIISTILIGLVHAEKDLFYKNSMYDGLTGLANMRLFKNLSTSMIASAHRNGEKNALLFIDIDGFKTINDTFGHKAGDDLLRQISVLLKNCIRDSDSIARFGGDEFIIQLDGGISESGAETVASNIIESISNAFDFGESVARVGASIGISIYPRDGADIDTLISKADRAMYAAKASGKNCYRLHGQST